MLLGLIIVSLIMSINSFRKAKKDVLDEKTVNEFVQKHGREMTDEDIANERARLKKAGMKELLLTVVFIIVWIFANIVFYSF